MVSITKITVFTTFTSLLLSILSAIDYTNKICLNNMYMTETYKYSFDHWDLNDKPVYRDYYPYVEAYGEIDFNTDNYYRLSNDGGNKWGITNKMWLYKLFVNHLNNTGTYSENLEFWCSDDEQPDKFLDCKQFKQQYNELEPIINIGTSEDDMGMYFTDCGDEQFNKDNILVNIVIKECRWAYTNKYFSSDGEEKKYHIINTNTCSQEAKNVCDGEEECEFLVTTLNSPECIGYSTEELNNYSWQCQLDE